jgi:methyl-accepting chemotaxis protein
MSLRLDDLSITVKVAAAPVVVAICLLVAAGAAYLVNVRTGRAVELVANEGLPHVIQTTTLSERSTRAFALVMQSLAYEGAGMKAELIATIDKQIPEEFKAMHAEVQQMKARSAGEPDALARYAAADAAVSKLEKAASDVIDMKSGGLAGAAMFLTGSEKAFADLKVQTAALTSHEIDDGRAQALSAATAVDFGNRLIGGLTFAGLLLSALATWTCVRLITRPLARALAIAREVAGGNLRRQDVQAGSDATGQVLSALDQVSTQLSQTIAGIRGAADQIDTASKEIAQGNLDLSSRTEQTASALEQTAATMEHLSSAVRNNAATAQQAKQVADGALVQARQGGDAVDDVVRTMATIDEQAKHHPLLDQGAPTGWQTGMPAR